MWAAVGWSRLLTVRPKQSVVPSMRIVADPTPWGSPALACPSGETSWPPSSTAKKGGREGLRPWASAWLATHRPMSATATMRDRDGFMVSSSMDEMAVAPRGHDAHGLVRRDDTGVGGHGACASIGQRTTRVKTGGLCQLVACQHGPLAGKCTTASVGNP